MVGAWRHRSIHFLSLSLALVGKLPRVVAQRAEGSQVPGEERAQNVAVGLRGELQSQMSELQSPPG